MTGPRKKKEKKLHHDNNYNHIDNNNISHRHHQHPTSHTAYSATTQHKTHPPNSSDRHKTNNRLRFSATTRTTTTTTNNNNNNNITDDRDNDRLFPAWTPYVVWLLCTLWRVNYVRQPANWWILHPDEIFQSLEVAHTQVYGYGFRPYEFSSLSHDPAPEGASSDDVSYYRKRELELGMHGMRSALYPNFYVIVSYMTAIIGLSVRPFVLWKMAHAFVASLLPLAVYRFTNVYFRSHDASCLAAIFIAASMHLNVFGTHPFLNSFLSPAVFWALSCISPMVCGQNSNATSREEEQLCVGERISYSFFSLNGLFSVLNTKPPLGLNAAGDASNRLVSSIKEHTYTNQDQQTACSPREAHSRVREYSKIQGSRKTEDGVQSQADHEMLHTSAEDRRVDSVELVVSSPIKLSSAESFLGGFVLALCVYMRADVALLAAAVLVPVWRPFRADYGRMCLCFAGACSGLILAVLQDFWFYDELVLSPKNWAKFNVFGGLSGYMFGQSSSWKYVHILFAENAGLCALAVICGFALLFAVGERMWTCLASSICYHHHHHNKKNADQDTSVHAESLMNSTKSRKRNQGGSFFTTSTEKTSFVTMVPLTRTVTFTFSWVSLLLFYSCKDHKELRFIHNAAVLMLVSFAVILYFTTKQVTKGRLTRRQQRIQLLVLLAAFAADQWRCFPSSQDRSNRPWAYQRIWDSHDVNACLGYVGSQDDVTGVFMDSNFHSSGGYALLHKDVPLFSLLVHEFVEFDDVASKVRLPRPSLLDSSKNVSYVTIDSLSNYVSVQNAAYAVKLLIEKRRYNYFIIARDRKFLTYGFKEAFAHGTMRVMKRTFDRTEEQQLQALVSDTPIGVNGTVLKYEGDVLFRFHRFRLALERYLAAVQLDPKQPQTYQAIAACKKRLGDQSEAIRWMQTCTKRFGVNECSQPLRVTNINPDRQLF